MTKKTVTLISHNREFDGLNGKEVEAYLVAGEEGVRGFYVEGPIIYTINGDDGAWWPVDHGIHVHWVPGILSALTEAAKEAADHVKP